MCIGENEKDSILAAKLEVFDVLDEMIQGPNMFHHKNMTINEHPEEHFKCLICGAEWTLYSPKQGKAAHKEGCLAVKLWEAYDKYFDIKEEMTHETN